MAKTSKKSTAKVSVAKVAKAMKARNKVKGKGDFFSDAWNGVKNFTKKVLGQGIHKGVDWLSNRAHDAIKGVVGNGDYLLPGAHIAYNSLYSGASQVPMFASTKTHANVIQHRESLGVIRSSSALQRTSLVLNPGLSTFPWISEIASGWQRYRVHGAIIEWIPAVTPLNTNAGGRVVLSTRYDLSSAPPSSVQMAETAFGAVVGRPMDQMAMPIECRLSQMAVNALNVRFGELPAGANAQFFDHCIIDVVNSGQADGTSDIGEVFITYELEFMMPISEHLSNATVACFNGYAAISTAAPAGPIGTSPITVRSQSNLSIGFTATSSTLTIDFDSLQPLPVGSTWVLNVQIAATGNITAPTITRAADLGTYPIYKGALGTNASYFDVGGASTAYSLDYAFVVNAATTNQSILLSSMALAAASTGYMTVTLMPLVSGLAALRMRARYPALYELEDKLAAKFASMSQIAVAQEPGWVH